MSEQKKKQAGGITRREFLKDGGLIVGGAAIGAAITYPLVPKEEKVVEWWLPDKWDKEADVVIVGYGGAGASAALTAAKEGAEVLVLEKASVGGGNSKCIGGGLMTPIDEEKAMEYMKFLTLGLTEEDVLRAYIKRLLKLPEWLHALGIAGTEGEPITIPGLNPEWPNAPGAEGIKGYMITGGPPTYNTIAGHAEDAGLEVMYETPARRLIQNEKTKEILGVIAESEGREIAIKARKAVVLACGGFEFDDRMVVDNITECPTAWLGTPHNTGDGIRMALDVGAQLWHMHSQAAPWMPGLKTPEGVYSTPMVVMGQPFPPIPTFVNGGYIWVNRNGDRFTNETIEFFTIRHGARLWKDWFDYDAMKLEFVNFPAFIVLDEGAKTAGPVMLAWWPEATPWSSDNSREIDKGWVVKADTIEELASKCKMINEKGVEVSVPADKLKATIEKYNAYCESGADPDFQREAGLVPFGSPPYYAVLGVVPAGGNTQGGPKHDDKQRVLDTNDKPIPRLYAVGECGSLWGPYYNGGANVTEFMVSGQIAGENVVTETPWG